MTSTTDPATQATSKRPPTRRTRRTFGRVRRLPSGRWQARFSDPSGRLRTAPTTFATRTAADEWLSTQRADLLRGVWLDPGSGEVTVADFMWTWIAQRTDLSPHTRWTYEVTIARWIDRALWLPAPNGGRALSVNIGARALQRHVGGDAYLDDVLAAHGVHVDDQLHAWVGQQDLVVVHVGSELVLAAGREVVLTGDGLFEAMDSESGDVADLAGALIPSEDDPDKLVSNRVIQALPHAHLGTDTVILLKTVEITPVLRGFGLGAWAASQSVALFDAGNTLVATQAAPITKRDAIPGFEDGSEMTPAESKQWDAEQQRLAVLWQSKLGLVPFCR